MGHITSVLQIFATLIALAGLFLVWNQLRLLRRQMAFQSLTHFQKIVTKPKLQEALRSIYSLDTDELANLPKDSCKPNKLANHTLIETLKKVELILNNYDLLAWRIRKGVIPLDDVIEIEWPVLLRIWKQLGPFIKEEKKIRGDVPYKEDLRWLIKEACKYKKKHYPDLSVKIIRREKV